MHPQQLRHTYMQCGAETDRRAQPAHRPEHLFRQPARHRQLSKELEAFFKARDAYMAGRHLHNEALALGRWLAVLVAAAVSSGRLGRDSDPPAAQAGPTGVEPGNLRSAAGPAARTAAAA